MMHVDFFNEVTTAIREKLAAIGGSKANNGKLVFFDGIVTFTVDYSGRYEEPFIDLVDYFVDGQIVLLESSLEIKLNMSQPVGFYGKMPKEKVITTATPPTDDGKTGIISREDLDVIQTSEGWPTSSIISSQDWVTMVRWQEFLSTMPMKIISPPMG